MISPVATIGSRPTDAQKRWLASVFGQEAWRELCTHSDFVDALDSSLDQARRIGLRRLAEKERYLRQSSLD